MIITFNAEYTIFMVLNVFFGVTIHLICIQWSLVGHG